MKIGVIGVGYNCRNYVDSVLGAWSVLKLGQYNDNGEQIQKPKHDVKICVLSALWQEYWQEGKTYDNNAASKLRGLESAGVIDKFIEYKKDDLQDRQSRILCYDELKDFGPDIIWQLDFDEIYSIKDIEKAISFIENDPYSDWYRINFKNFFNDTNHWYQGFCPPRIHRNKHGGIIRFDDNNVQYADGQWDRSKSNREIPVNVAFPEHFSWCGEPEFLRRKVEYQMKCLGNCSFKFDDSLQRLKINDSYPGPAPIIVRV